jgi:hypothetical protein
LDIENKRDRCERAFKKCNNSKLFLLKSTEKIKKKIKVRKKIKARKKVERIKMVVPSYL